MNLPYPDSPTPVSLDFLKKLDQDAPGTWLAQSKLDGWRRCCWKECPGGNWTIRSKKGSDGFGRPLPQDLFRALLVLDGGFSLDIEWTGPRQAGSLNRLFAFDVLIRDVPFKDRMEILKALPWPPAAGLTFLPARPNPGLVDFFQEQVSNPLSEGLVIRRADSKLILSETACATNPYILKVKYRNVKEKA